MTARLSDYQFVLPPELIAQHPSPERTASRLMSVTRGVGLVGEGTYADLPGLVRGDELLVFNDTRVVPARLRGHKDSGGRIELLVLRSEGPDTFRALGRASKGFAPGQRLTVGDGTILTVREVHGEGEVTVALPDGHVDLWTWLDGAGELPLPPYIARPEGPSSDDAARYQTVFANEPGSVAAPTAGLHFTDDLLSALAARGCETARVTLHVGPGTFAPVRTDDLDAHRMHSERYEVNAVAAAAIASARREGRKVLAVGTTVVRTLEAVAAANQGQVPEGAGETAIFIREGHRFQVVDQLLTNFHLPQSTLLVLVSAFAGREVTLAAYEEAVRRRFRFFSYGDGMLLR